MVDPAISSPAPKASVVIAVFNGAETVGKAIDSALAQTEQNIEIVVVNDGSADGTADLVRAYAEKDRRVRLFTLEKNKGQSFAANFGFEQAGAEWVAVLDADDWFEPNHIEILLAAAERAKADIAFDNLRIFDHALGKIIEDTCYGKRDQAIMLNAETFIRRDNPLRRHSMGYCKPMFRKKFLADHKLAYDASYRLGMDFLLLAEALLCGAKTVIVPEAAYVYFHMFSPTSRKKSPTSHTRNNGHEVVAAANGLLTKYGASMTRGERSAIIQRRKIFESRIRCVRMLEAFHNNRFGQGLLIVLKDPFIFMIVAAAGIRMLYANFLAFRQVARVNVSP